MKSKSVLVAIATLLISGCAHPPAIVAAWYDSQDACQSRGRADYRYPAWCGAASDRSYIYTNGSRRVGYIAK